MKTKLSVLLAIGAAAVASAAEKNIVLIAGKQSHGPGDHEFRAGCLLLKKCLNPVPGIRVQVYTNGWPASDSALDVADAVIIYADGGAGIPRSRVITIQKSGRPRQKALGLAACITRSKCPKATAGAAMQRWIGGYYEHLYSVNPMWVPEFQSYPHMR